MRFIRDRLNIARSKNDIIGLDIGYSSIKCVVLRGSGDTSVPYELKNYSIKAIPSGAVWNNDIKSQSSLAIVIKEWLEKEAIYSKCCVAALPDTLVSSKWTRIDCSAVESIEVAINLAVEKHIPYPLDAIYFDYQLFDNQQEEVGYLNVLLVACRKEHLDARLNILHQANLTPLFIEVNSHAVERAYLHFYSASTTESCVLIDIGMAQLTILFLDQAKQLRSCSERVMFSNNEAVLQQTQRVINAIFLTHPFCKWNKLLFIGSNLSLLKFLVKKMHGFLGLKAATITWETPLFSLGGLNAKEFKKLFPSLFLSIGLALRAI